MNKLIVFVLCLLLPIAVSAKVVSEKQLIDILTKNAYEYRHIIGGIVYSESSGHFDAVGDGTASVGLCQIHQDTMLNMVKKGMITSFNGRKVTLNRVLKLRNDPAFNVYAARILFEDNKRIIEMEMNKRYPGLFDRMTLDKYNEIITNLTILAHNIGAPQVIKTRIANNQWKHLKNSEYINKVKSNMNKLSWS